MTDPKIYICCTCEAGAEVRQIVALDEIDAARKFTEGWPDLWLPAEVLVREFSFHKKVLVKKL